MKQTKDADKVPALAVYIFWLSNTLKNGIFSVVLFCLACGRVDGEPGRLPHPFTTDVLPVLLSKFSPHTRSSTSLG
jgi:hypothetical protein